MSLKGTRYIEMPHLLDLPVDLWETKVVKWKRAGDFSQLGELKH